MRSMRAPNYKRHQRGFKSRAVPRPNLISGVFRVQPSSRTGLKLGGRYEIVGLVDHGGSSEVYLARDARTALLVIVKMLTAEAAMDPQHRERFIIGARLTMGIDHPAIARVYGVEVPPNEPPYLIMEALQGESLADYLDREKTMSQPMTLALAREAASGLVAAHRAGIIHRDIKPGNLYLLGPPGTPYGIKIIDFGLSKDMRHIGSGPISVNMVLGTAQYMAPEQVLADPIDVRTDIYAFGVVLFGMLTGQLPFDLKPGADLFSHQLFSPAPPPSWLMQEVDPRLEQLILRCLRKHPENRYASMQALLDDLTTIENNPLTAASEISVPVLQHQPDVYVPKGSEGRGVAEDLARHFGVEIPPPPTLRMGAEPEDTLDGMGFESVRERPRNKLSKW